MALGTPFFWTAMLGMAGVASDGSDADGKHARQALHSADTRQAFDGPAQNFTGTVKVEMLFPPTESTPFSGAAVTFSPGARTAWHQHPAGQHMVVLSGTALTGTRDGRVIAFGEGETVWCPPDLDHWHGATPHRAMTHLVITGSRDGANVTWKEKVPDEVYLAAVPAATAAADGEGGLDAASRAIVPIAAFTATGDQPALALAIRDGLDAGLGVSAIQEVQLHLYAYAGFPRTLNGLGTLMSVVAQRRAAGTTDAPGPAPDLLADGSDRRALGEAVQTALVGRPVAGPLFEFAPGANELLQAHLFGDLFARGVLDHAEREVATIAALASLRDVESQLASHFAMGANAGLTPAQLADLVATLQDRVGITEARRARQALAALPPAQGAAP